VCALIAKARADERRDIAIQARNAILSPTLQTKKILAIIEQAQYRPAYPTGEAMNSNPAVTESLEHDPLCPCNPNQQECGCGEDPEWGPCVSCKCDLIAKVRADTLDKVIASIQPIWERGKALGDAVFADGWLTCFECCESALETMKSKP